MEPGLVEADTIPAEMAADWVAALNALTDLYPDNTADTGKYRYKYVDLAAVCSTAREVLSAHNLAVHQEAFSQGGDIVGILTRVWHTSGGSITSGVLWMRSGGGPQDVGTAITYGRRYALMAMLGLAPDDDDDGRSAQAAVRRGDERVDRLVEAMRAAAPSVQAELKRWADGRSLAGAELYGDAAWRLAVEKQLALLTDTADNPEAEAEEEAF